MRIYHPDREALAALRGSGITLVLDVRSFPPSRGVFVSPAARWHMLAVARFLRDTDAPLLSNMPKKCYGLCRYM
jgi:hypothetical protein